MDSRGRLSPHKPSPQKLRSGLGDFGEDFLFFFFFGRAAEVVFGEAVAEESEGVFGRVDELEQVQIVGGDGAGVDEGLEVHDAVPVFAAVDDDQNFLGKLVGLREGEDFEKFVDGAEAAGKNHQRFGEIGEPEFAHEEIMELEVERGGDVGVGILLEGQVDVEADALASGLVGAEVGGFHDAGTAAGGDDEAAAAGGNLDGPFGKEKSEAARVFVVAGHVDGGARALQIVFMVGGREVCFIFFYAGEILPGGIASLKARRAEKDNGVLDLLPAKTRERFLIFGEDAQDAAVGAVDEGLILVGQGRGFELIDHVCNSRS
jgi:hypothetical protein